MLPWRQPYANNEQTIREMTLVLAMRVCRLKGPADGGIEEKQNQGISDQWQERERPRVICIASIKLLVSYR